MQEGDLQPLAKPLLSCLCRAPAFRHRSRHLYQRLELPGRVAVVGWARIWMLLVLASHLSQGGWTRAGVTVELGKGKL